MDKTDRLTILKLDVGIAGNAKDEYLEHLLGLAEKEIKKEGIKEEEESEYDGVLIQYAAYLFRKRASSETSMPRFLRYALNNLLLDQKARGL